MTIFIDKHGTFQKPTNRWTTMFCQQTFYRSYVSTQPAYNANCLGYSINLAEPDRRDGVQATAVANTTHCWCSDNSCSWNQSSLSFSRLFVRTAKHSQTFSRLSVIHDESFFPVTRCHGSDSDQRRCDITYNRKKVNCFGELHNTKSAWLRARFT